MFDFISEKELPYESNEALAKQYNSVIKYKSDKTMLSRFTFWSHESFKDEYDICELHNNEPLGYSSFRVYTKKNESDTDKHTEFKLITEVKEPLKCNKGRGIRVIDRI